MPNSEIDRLIIETIDLIKKSGLDALYSEFSRNDIENRLVNFLQADSENRQLLRESISILFAPTGAIQETAIDNGWEDKCLKISAEIDRYFQKHKWQIAEEVEILLYKYKSLSNLSHITELLVESVLHCSNLNELNDPWEGSFIYKYSHRTTQNGMSSDSFRTVRRSIFDFPEIQKFRICSFSSDYKNELLWSYYADSFRGICIALDIDDNLISERSKSIAKFNRVSYNGFMYYQNTRINQDFEVVNILPSEKTILRMIANKAKPWKHEDEYRLISLEAKVPIPGRIAAVYIGERSDRLSRLAIKRLAGEIPVKILSIRREWSNRRDSTMWEEEEI